MDIGNVAPSGFVLGFAPLTPTYLAGVNCQERTYGELKETLKITLREALAFNREEALILAGGDYREDRTPSLHEKGAFARILEKITWRKVYESARPKRSHSTYKKRG
uniref:Uncharacterized protein n=1 Tax=Candidatus Kentrum sp. DK TaxID=2126562 RepID=A0A450T0W5_9GAMM|nr:MAG: hypothetical protein BECKDK2373B_GA0170837_109011 [Candidatus Kentron sp. DK]VFJ64536.1 MAG: hypothetical protein BECKDK2373C_GA0170839_11193 [Candidatus Kentron sp. DK]